MAVFFTYPLKNGFFEAFDMVEIWFTRIFRAFAWGLSDKEELHSEYGYITIEPGARTVSLTTVMDNGEPWFQSSRLIKSLLLA